MNRGKITMPPHLGGPPRKIDKMSTILSLQDWIKNRDAAGYDTQLLKDAVELIKEGMK